MTKADDHRIHGRAVADAHFTSNQKQDDARARIARIAAHLGPPTTSEIEELHFDYVIVGGGTAGAVLADRLSADPALSIAVIEGGPSDVGNDAVLDLSNWMALLGSGLDYDYTTTEQRRGNSHIRHSRARVLGGCSSHNTAIAFPPLRQDLDTWAQAYGCPTWAPDKVMPLYDRIKLHVEPVARQHRNDVVQDWVRAAAATTGAPIVEDGFHSHLTRTHGHATSAPFEHGVGFFDVAYDPHTRTRSSASVAYLHPIMPTGPRPRTNLHLFLETWASKIEFEPEPSPSSPSGQGMVRAKGVRVTNKQGHTSLLRPKHDLLLCAGAIDTPRLLLLSGIGPKRELEALGIPCVSDVPGVGRNLQDHPESIVMWETRETPERTVMASDAGLFLVRGIHLARHIAAHPLFARHLVREIAPGPHLQSDAELDAYARSVAHTVYHPAGTCRMGRLAGKEEEEEEEDSRDAADDDDDDETPDEGKAAAAAAAAAAAEEGTRMVVVDESTLHLRTTSNVRIADASVLPALSSTNPMMTVLLVAEVGAERVLGALWEGRRTGEGRGEGDEEG